MNLLKFLKEETLNHGNIVETVSGSILLKTNVLRNDDGKCVDADLNEKSHEAKPSKDVSDEIDVY